VDRECEEIGGGAQRWRSAGRVIPRRGMFLFSQAVGRRLILLSPLEDSTSMDRGEGRGEEGGGISTRARMYRGKMAVRELWLSRTGEMRPSSTGFAADSIRAYDYHE